MVFFYWICSLKYTPYWLYLKDRSNRNASATLKEKRTINIIVQNKEQIRRQANGAAHVLAKEARFLCLFHFLWFCSFLKLVWLHILIIKVPVPKKKSKLWNLTCNLTVPSWTFKNKLSLFVKERKLKWLADFILVVCLY